MLSLTLLTPSQDSMESGAPSFPTTVEGRSTPSVQKKPPLPAATTCSTPVPAISGHSSHAPPSGEWPPRSVSVHDLYERHLTDVFIKALASDSPTRGHGQRGPSAFVPFSPSSYFQGSRCPCRLWWWTLQCSVSFYYCFWLLIGCFICDCDKRIINMLLIFCEFLLSMPPVNFLMSFCIGIFHIGRCKLV